MAADTVSVPSIWMAQRRPTAPPNAARSTAVRIAAAPRPSTPLSQDRTPVRQAQPAGWERPENRMEHPFC